jgi:hypothetical protein
VFLSNVIHLGYCNNNIKFYSVPYLTTKVSPALPVVASILFIFVISSLLKTTLTDPGIIPRPSNREAIEYDRQAQAALEPGIKNTTVHYL